MADIEKIAEELSTLTVLEAAELATLLEEKWGVSAAAAPVAMAMPAGGGDAGAAAEEQTEFDVVLHRCWCFQDQCDQGSPRYHRSRTERSQGPRRRWHQSL